MHDGDKNAVYLLPKRKDGYDTSRSYKYIVAKIELAAAFRKMVTLIGTPRYSLSETNLMLIERNKHRLEDLEFSRRTMSRGPR